MEQEELHKSLNNRTPAMLQIIALALLVATAIALYFAAVIIALH